jgi:hypothetical protein
VEKLSQFTPALGTALARRISSLSSRAQTGITTSQVASYSPNACGNSSQTFGQALGHLTFTDKRIGPSGECSLMTGVQMADENYDQRSRAGFSELF